MKITMLGTGHAVVTECYNTCFVISDDDRHFLVDGGGGMEILRQLKQVHIPVNNIHEIFVTHKHIDHLLGIVWMMRLITSGMHAGKYEGDAYIYAHDEVISILHNIAEETLGAPLTVFIGNRLHLVAVADKEEKTIIGKKVTFFDIHSTKAKQFGFCMDMGDGRKLSCCGDEPCSTSCYPYVENSEWLLHEAFCLYSQADIFAPYEKHHSTAKDASELAEKLHVKNLLLYHTEDKNIKNRKELYTAEGRQYFSGNLYVPYDLETLEL